MTPAARRTTGTPGGGTQVTASRHVGIDRERHGHTMATGDTAPDPFSRSAQNEARRDPFTLKMTGSILARPRHPAGSIVSCVDMRQSLGPRA